MTQDAAADLLAQHGKKSKQVIESYGNAEACAEELECRQVPIKTDSMNNCNKQSQKCKTYIEIEVEHTE